MQIDTVIHLFNTAINKKNGGIKLLVEGSCDTMQPNDGQMAILKAEAGKLKENALLQRELSVNQKFMKICHPEKIRREYRYRKIGDSL